jgi:hypothetical protein
MVQAQLGFILKISKKSCGFGNSAEAGKPTRAN